MKVISFTLLVCAMIACAAADYATDVRINRTYVGFIQQFEAFVQNTSYDAVLQAYGSQLKGNGSNTAIKGQALDEMKQLSNNITAAVMTQYKPIAYKIIYDAGYNTKGNYYIYENKTKQWHLPNQAAPAKPVDGASLNMKQLSKELEDAFIALMPAQKGSTGLQRRMFGLGKFFSTSQTTSFIRNIEHLPPSNVIDEISKFRVSNTKLGAKDTELLETSVKSATEQQKWRVGASLDEVAADGTISNKGLRELLDEVDAMKSYHERKTTLETKLNELLNKPSKADIDNTDIDIIYHELKKLGDLISRDANVLFRSRVTRVIVYFFT